MNERIRELAEQALFESDFDDEQNIKITMDIFAELIVKHIIDKIEQEAEIAWAHEQGYANAALNALSLEILDEFDMEFPDDESI